MPTRGFAALRVGLPEINNLSQTDFALPAHDPNFHDLIEPHAWHKECSAIGMTHNATTITS
jgi:hypothetical protein